MFSTDLPAPATLSPFRRRVEDAPCRQADSALHRSNFSASLAAPDDNILACFD
jgi:hypothetical protein